GGPTDGGPDPGAGVAAGPVFSAPGAPRLLLLLRRQPGADPDAEPPRTGRRLLPRAPPLRRGGAPRIGRAEPVGRVVYAGQRLGVPARQRRPGGLVSGTDP